MTSVQHFLALHFKVFNLFINSVINVCCFISFITIITYYLFKFFFLMFVNKVPDCFLPNIKNKLHILQRKVNDFFQR